jgi:hypothetical protein
MWGQKWGEMIWNRASAVPAIGLWGALVLGCVIGMVAVVLLRSARKTGLLVSLLVLLLPLTAVATVPFVFTRGTIADASQVNTDFAAVIPVRGRTTTSTSINGTAATYVFPTSSFTPQYDMNCIVTVQPFVAASSGSVISWNTAIKVGSTPSTGPSPGPGLFTMTAIPSIGPEQNYVSTFTEMFSVTHGTSVSFGAQFTGSGGIYQPEVNVVYDCTILP